MTSQGKLFKRNLNKQKKKKNERKTNKSLASAAKSVNLSSVARNHDDKTVEIISNVSNFNSQTQNFSSQEFLH